LRNQSPVTFKIVNALLLCILCLLLAWGFTKRGEIAQYSPISLRYDTPVSGKSAYAARQYSISHSGGNNGSSNGSGGGSAFWLTFWREHKSEFKGEFASADADCIAYSGDASLVWPGEYITGSAPGVTDGSSCVLSESLAVRIFGSTDVTGMKVEVDGETRIIRGVIKGNSDLALISFRDDDTSRSWTAAELSGGPENASRSDAESFAILSGLGKPDAILTGGYMLAAGFLAVLPLLILTICVLALMVRFLRNAFPSAHGTVFFICFIALACTVPLIVSALPAWLIPTSWSDFSFWSSLLGSAADGLQEFINAAPRLRDAVLKTLLLTQAGIAFFAVCASIALCFRLSGDRMTRQRFLL